MTGRTEADIHAPAAEPARRRPVWRGLAAFLFGLSLGIAGIFLAAEAMVPPSMSPTSFLDGDGPPPLRR
jgi:hypothetical protein